MGHITDFVAVVLKGDRAEIHKALNQLPEEHRARMNASVDELRPIVQQDAEEHHRCWKALRTDPAVEESEGPQAQDNGKDMGAEDRHSEGSQATR
jgi:hypothetical protein